MTTLNRFAVSAAVLASFASTPALAQAGQAAGSQQVTRAQVAQQLDTEFKDLDANHDGKLTNAEILAAMQRQSNEQVKAVFDKIDTNHNGQISLAELQAQSRIDPAKVAARVTQLDTNKDGTVSTEEYRNGTLADFDRADANHDGVVSASEAGAR